MSDDSTTTLKTFDTLPSADTYGYHMARPSDLTQILTDGISSENDISYADSETLVTTLAETFDQPYPIDHRTTVSLDLFTGDLEAHAKEMAELELGTFDVILVVDLTAVDWPAYVEDAALWHELVDWDVRPDRMAISEAVALAETAPDELPDRLVTDATDYLQSIQQVATPENAYAAANQIDAGDHRIAGSDAVVSNLVVDGPVSADAIEGVWWAVDNPDAHYDVVLP